MSIQTVEWVKNSIKIIDQNKLPHKLEFLFCKDIDSLYNAIKNMNIRGAPALGVVGAFGIVLAAYNSKAETYKELSRDLKKAGDYLKTSRPTAVNLFWAIDRMLRKFKSLKEKSISAINKYLLKEALNIRQEDKRICRNIGEYGAKLINDGDNILTHCNAGGLATSDFGTALGIIYTAQKQNKAIHVYVDETRPRLQGARLTCWELQYNKIPYTLICDNMAADLMHKGKIDKIIVGADRIAKNGDTANKIGTYSLAVLSNFHKIPFYVAAPLSTFDSQISNGVAIVVEERDEDEIKEFCGKSIAPVEAKVYNPAFDITPCNLITAIITEKGIMEFPFDEKIKKICQ